MPRFTLRIRRYSPESGSAARWQDLVVDLEGHQSVLDGILQARDREDGSPLIRAGFTATRKIGGAVVRNRAKRRLREAARALVPVHGRPGCDYVLIARAATTARPWAALLDDVKSALISLAAARPAPSPVGVPDEPPPTL